jgi:guanine deaminase
MLTKKQEYFLARAIELSKQGMQKGQGGPFGCIITKGDEIVGEGYNRVTSSNDPTAHAEMIAIRQACKRLETYQLTDCELFTSCEPCPMCLGAIYWARLKIVIYANTKEEATAVGFDDDFIYTEINAKMTSRKIPFIHHPHPQAKAVFDAWKSWENKQKY